MHQLVLLRHAKAERLRDDQSDHDRALAPEGRDAAFLLRPILRAHGIEPDVVLVSSARRTRETLDCIAFWDERPNIEIVDALYMASATRLLDLLRSLRETMRSVMVIGHNPGVHDLALELAAGASVPSPAHLQLDRGYPTARAVDFLVLTPWYDLRSEAARLQRVIDPPVVP